jgi:oxygen-dependent protoporphyrinogen oxidase
MPGPGQDPFAMVWSMLTESIFKGLLKGGLFEYAQPSRPANLEDESIGSFLERRLGSAEPGNNIVSAVLHGIYAGDIYKLSAKSLMPGIWHEEGVHGSIMRAKMENGRAGESTMPYKDVLLDQDLKLKINQSLRETMSHASVYTFKGGLGTFSDALEKSLRANPNVQFKMGYEVGSLEYDETANAVKVHQPSISNTPLLTLNSSKLLRRSHHRDTLTAYLPFPHGASQ